jgi:hypothetical protein
LIPLGLTVILAACGGPKGAQNASNATEQRTQDERPVRGDLSLLGTPMAQRVAQVGLLNKRNGLTRTLTLKPGEALRVGNAIVRLRACETTAPWELEQDTGAFVQLDVQETRDNKWHRAFSGWLFKDRPERNVVNHPIYDVWVTSCAMSWPETGPETVRASEPGRRNTAPSASNESSAENSPESASPSPSASASPSNEE